MYLSTEAGTRLTLRKAKRRFIDGGPGGNLYFTEPRINEIVQITPNGVFTDVQAIKPAGSPWAIAKDAAPNLWITQIDGNKISRLLIP